MKPSVVATAMILFCLSAYAPNVGAAENPAAGSADTRGTSANPLNKQLYCVKNSESGACADCWADGEFSSESGTCKGLKSAANAPEVRKGQCSAPANKAFCGVKK